MRKILFVLLICVLTLNIQAQVFIGGTLEFNQKNQTNLIKSSDMMIIPMIGVNVNKNLALGIKFGYENQNAETFNEDFFISPLIRNIIPLYNDLNLNIDTTAPFYISDRNVSININPNLQYLLKEHISILISLGSIEYGSNPKVGTSYFNVTYETKFGILFYL